MDEFEEVEAGLRRSLQHVSAPPGFTEKVMQRVAEREAARLVGGKREARHIAFFSGANRQTAWWTAAAAALALSVGGGDALHLRHQREAAAAQAQVDLAMQLTSHALNGVQAGLHHSPAGRFTEMFNETGR